MLMTKEYMRILIPNQDKGDHTPWASFVLPAKSVHENKYGKGLWAKIPADGTTTVTKAVQVAEKLSPNTDRPRARAAGMEK